jgi:hypothetical protein
VDIPDAQFAKPDNPGKPGNKPGGGELITFTGYLAGSEVVEGCCPNRGPNPEYTMTLAGPPDPVGIAGTHDGHIFMNSWSPKGTDHGDYIVQFCWDGIEGHYLIEIKGGETVYNKRTKVLNVTFDEENIVEWKVYLGTETDHKADLIYTGPPAGAYFSLERDPNG